MADNNGPLTETQQTETKQVDWKDVIYISEDVKQPFLVMLPIGKRPKQTEHNWPVMKQVRGKPKAWPDGTPVGEGDYNHQGREKLRGLTQIFKEPWKVTDGADDTDTYGVGARNERKFQKREAIGRLKDQLEMTCLSAQDFGTESGEVGNTMRGAFAWLDPSFSFDSEYPVAEKYRPSTGSVYEGALDALTETAFGNILTQAQTDALKVRTLYGHVGPALQDRMDEWMAHDTTATATNVPLRRYTQAAAAKQIIRCVNIFQFSAGTVHTMANYNMLYATLAANNSRGDEAGDYAPSEYSFRSGVFIDPKQWEIRFQRGIEHEDLARDGSGYAGLFRARATLSCLMPRGQFMVKSNADT